MLKRGQVTVFIILGFVILAISLLLFSLNSNKGANVVDYGLVGLENLNPVKSFTESCLEEISLEGLEVISHQGGYYNVFQESQPFLTLDIPFYYYEEDNPVPEISQVEEELATYVKDNIDNCLKDFTSFRKQGYDFEYGDKEPKVKISDERILITLDYPLTVSSETSSKQLDTFRVSIRSNFIKVYNVVKEFIHEQQQNPNTLPLGFLSEQAYLNNFTVDKMYYGDGETVYILFFEESNPSVFAFGINYDWNIK